MLDLYAKEHNSHFSKGLNFCKQNETHEFRLFSGPSFHCLPFGMLFLLPVLAPIIIFWKVKSINSQLNPKKRITLPWHQDRMKLVFFLVYYLVWSQFEVWIQLNLKKVDKCPYRLVHYRILHGEGCGLFSSLGGPSLMNFSADLNAGTLFLMSNFPRWPMLDTDCNTLCLLLLQTVSCVASDFGCRHLKFL